jgi:acyl-CoA synthetase (AMP-forming)/AMP-acid ligase II
MELVMGFSDGRGIEHALEPGNTVAIMLPTGRDYFFSFFGILLAGGVPVPRPGAS